MEKDIFRLFKTIKDALESKANIDLKPYGLTIGQCGVLGYLSTMENQTASLKNLEKAFEVSQATMQGTISRLIKKDFIELNISSDDKRIKNATLTKIGKKVWIEANKARMKNQKQLFENFNDDDISKLKELLTKLYKSI